MANNSTDAIAPVVAEALTTTAWSAPAEIVALAGGVAIATFGAVPALTVTTLATEVAEAPLLPVAVAVSE